MVLGSHGSFHDVLQFPQTSLHLSLGVSQVSPSIAITILKLISIWTVTFSSFSSFFLFLKLLPHSVAFCPYLTDHCSFANPSSPKDLTKFSAFLFKLTSLHKLIYSCISDPNSNILYKAPHSYTPLFIFRAFPMTCPY